MTVLAIGLDLVELDRFRLLYGGFDPEVLQRVFTPAEQAFDGSDSDRLSRLAARLAIKEAVLKTIGGLQDGISWTDIELLSDGVTAPRVSVTGGARDAATSRGISDWMISLTHGTHSAAAVALAVGSIGT